MIPGLRRSPGSPGEGTGYPLQFSLTSSVTQMVKNLPAMWETWVQPLGWEDPMEKGMTIHSSILAWRNPMDRGAWWTIVHGVAESDTTDKAHSTYQTLVPDPVSVFSLHLFTAWGKGYKTLLQKKKTDSEISK